MTQQVMFGTSLEGMGKRGHGTKAIAAEEVEMSGARKRLATSLVALWLGGVAQADAVRFATETHRSTATRWARLRRNC